MIQIQLLSPNVIFIQSLELDQLSPAEIGISHVKAKIGISLLNLIALLSINGDSCSLSIVNIYKVTYGLSNGDL